MNTADPTSASCTATMTALWGSILPRSANNGWGGAFAFADPDAGLGVAYTMNRMLGRSADSQLRHGCMNEAVYGALRTHSRDVAAHHTTD